MKSTYGVLPVILATLAMAAPKVYLAGDSTMAVGGGGTGTEGTFYSLPPSKLAPTNIS